MTFLKETFLTPPYFKGCHKVPSLCSDSIFKIAVGIASWVIKSFTMKWVWGAMIFIITKLLSIRNGHFFGDGN